MPLYYLDIAAFTESHNTESTKAPDSINTDDNYTIEKQSGNFIIH